MHLTKRCYSVSTQKYFDVVVKRLSLANEYNHLQFQVAVITCWCTAPKIILEPSKATAAIPLTSPPARTAQCGGLRTPAPAPTPAQASSNGASSKSTANAAPTPAEKISQITEKRVVEAKASYATSPELHTINWPLLQH